MDAVKLLYGLLSKLFLYPASESARAALSRVGDIAELAESVDPELGRSVRLFAEESRGIDLETHYISVFELPPRCPPYAHYWLFKGREEEAGAFLVRLKALYREAGFDIEAELPDYLPAVLEYLAHADGDARKRVVREYLLSWADKLVKCLEDAGSPYAHLARAVKRLAELEANV